MWGHQIRVLRPLAGAPRLDTEHARPAYSTILPSRVLSVGPWLQGDDLKIWCQNKEVNAPLAQVRTEDCKARNVILSSAGVRPGAFEAPKAAGLRSASPPATGKPLGSTPKKAGASPHVLPIWKLVIAKHGLITPHVGWRMTFDLVGTSSSSFSALACWIEALFLVAAFE
jgi:hypothetical protein